MLAVTHDRYFLDNVAEWICEVDRGSLYPYKGNYSTYLETKAARMAAQGQRDAKLAKRMQNELEWVRCSPRRPARPRTRPRLERYEQMEAEARAGKQGRLHRHPHSRGPAPGREGPRRSSTSTRASATACSSTTCRSSLPRNGIVGVIGPNGVGKSTLFKMIVRP